jgi:hypothetical protein
MPYNVNRVIGGSRSDEEAIAWCLLDGNTTAVSRDEWAQRIPEDLIDSPLPESLSMRTDDHHLGLGLGHLVRLVETTHGELWILSGKGQYHFGPHGGQLRRAGTNWQGVVMELSIPVVQTSTARPADEKALDDLGRRLGL